MKGKTTFKLKKRSKNAEDALVSKYKNKSIKTESDPSKSIRRFFQSKLL